VAAKVDEFEFFLEKDWSDGFPVVTPTRSVYGGCSKARAAIPMKSSVASRRTGGCNRAHDRDPRADAGCKPEYLPVVLGGTELILRDEINMGGVQCTMHGVAPLMIVNGPTQTRSHTRRQRVLRPGISRQRDDRPRDPPDAAQPRRRHCGPRVSHRIRESAAVHCVPRGEYRAQPVGKPRRIARIFSGRQRDYRRHGGKPRLHLTIQQRSRAAPDRNRRCDGRGRLVEHVVASNVVVAMSPQHAKVCADAGMSRADVHRRLCELGGRRQGDLKRGGNWRPERARAMGIDPDDDECFIRAVKEPAGLHLIVAGGTGPTTAVCHGGTIQAARFTASTRFKIHGSRFSAGENHD